MKRWDTRNWALGVDKTKAPEDTLDEICVMQEVRETHDPVAKL
jgi:hypothetical protein